MKSLNFIVVLEEPPPEKHFSLKNLPGTSKIDVVCRNILTLFSKKTFNYTIRYFAIFTQKKPLVLLVKELPKSGLPLDEISIASLLREELNHELKKIDQILDADTSIAFFEIANFLQFLKIIQSEQNCLLYLTEKGKDYEKIFDEILDYESLFFFLGGRKDLTSIHEQQLLSLNPIEINLGKTSYLASSCILKTIFEIEKRL